MTSDPRQFDVQNYGNMDAEERMSVWKTLEEALRSHKTIEVHFTGTLSASRLRREIYQHFGGYEITFNRVTHSRVHILVGPEKIRTTASPDTTGAERTKYPEELKRHEEVPVGFDFTPEEADIVGHISRLCPVCERRLPLNAFNRSRRGRIQSYCIECNRAYQKWRYATLCELGVPRLTPAVTEGHRKRNERFREWFKTYQDT